MVWGLWTRIRAPVSMPATTAIVVNAVQLMDDKLEVLDFGLGHGTRNISEVLLFTRPLQYIIHRCSRSPSIPSIGT